MYRPRICKTLPKTLRLTKLLGDKDFERWILCEMKGYSPNTINATEVVPEYRIVTGRHMDIYGRPLMLEDPNLSFVNVDRLRLSVRELEAHANKDGILYIQKLANIQILKEELGVDVIQFAFNRASIHGILDSIRSELLDRLHKIEQTLASATGEPQVDGRKRHRNQQPDRKEGEKASDAHTDVKLDAIEVQLMKALTERSHLTPGRAATLIGCRAAVAEHRLHRLSRAGLVRSDSFGADGAAFHLTFEGRDWLHRHGHLD
jgi:AbiTii